MADPQSTILDQVELQAKVMMITSNILCSTFIVLYLCILVKTFSKPNVRYMQAMLLLFTTSQICWCVAYTLLNDAVHSNTDREFKFNGSLLAFGVFNSFYSLAHWVFAFHFYSTAICLQNDNPNFTQMRVLFWTMALANLVLPFWQNGYILFNRLSISA